MTVYKGKGEEEWEGCNSFLPVFKEIRDVTSAPLTQPSQHDTHNAHPVGALNGSERDVQSVSPHGSFCTMSRSITT